jgi:hypothetical protein
VETVKVLVKMGGDVQAQGADGSTPLHRAAVGGLWEVEQGMAAAQHPRPSEGEAI